MEIAASKVIFYIIAAAILFFALLSVTSKRILRAATYLFIVLISTAALYFLLNYQFLGAVQIALYAGGIVVMIIFSILLTSHAGQKFEPVSRLKFFASLLAVLVGWALSLWVILSHPFVASSKEAVEVNMDSIGKALLSYDRNGYVLVFEVISILLLAAMIGAIVISKKQPGDGETNPDNSKTSK
ncbi:MAG: NADH-quinone oxidoreductase subunit J [Bacteroidales bacterium]|jgi:NADH-quinone oxidoreductase subunit J|nr:NADH-quinone oxidoreductase subunit J [Bacteroidales bacterium]HNT41280.1 NADH-quinone oxidoreductase subunit J [Tenuifilaceae bacterium]MBP8643858.1 NADH-quinone oxidoreductase subunit J [Bacteroidales bacterium]NLI87228.1 NADH-quinone oxidoreductase subunit J [Bacteroidales bacterium]HOA10012.1 NADH-quinone oxidoreductase subunit J [Tenuifilaceae bacterium]